MSSQPVLVRLVNHTKEVSEEKKNSRQLNIWSFALSFDEFFSPFMFYLARRKKSDINLLFGAFFH